jgi:adenosine deaminase
VHHAGETAGPASIRAALGPGRAERLGHGIRVLEDPALAAEVAAAGVPLEVCPSSNVALGLVPSFDAHPLPRLRAAGLAVTLNTDIPSVTGGTLTDEYARCREVFGWTDAELAGIAAAGVVASFAPTATKDRLLAEIRVWSA